MALEFRKRHFHKPGRKGQLALSIAALLLALCIAVVWSIIHFRDDPSVPTDDETLSSASENTFTADDTANLLLIFDNAAATRFTLIQSDPEDMAVRIAMIPHSLSVSDGNTLLSVYLKDGAAAATRAANTTLRLPINQYVCATQEAMDSLFDRLDGGIQISLEQPIEYRDYHGRSIRLDQGEHTLEASQAAEALFDPSFSPFVLCATVNGHLRDGRYLSADFAHLANTTKTSLRIGDFNDYYGALAHIATNNTGNVCEVVSLYGNANKDVYCFDADKTASMTPLYN